MAYKKFLKGISALALVLCLIIAGCSDDSDNSSQYNQDNNDNNNSNDNNDNDNNDNNNNNNNNGDNANSLFTITDMPQGYIIDWGFVMNKSDIEWTFGTWDASDASRDLALRDDFFQYVIGYLGKIEGNSNTASINSVQYKFVNDEWTIKSLQGEFNYSGKASVYLNFETGQNPILHSWGWNDVDFVNGKATVAFPNSEDIGSSKFPAPIGKLTITNIPDTYNSKYIFLAGGASDVTSLYGMNYITFLSNSNYAYRLVQISDGIAEVPLYKINAGATSYSTLFSPYDGNGSVSALSVLILSDSEFNVANTSSVTSSYVASTSITSGTFSGGNLTVSSVSWTSHP